VGCPNLQPAEVPGNFVFSEVYQLAGSCRDGEGKMDYSVLYDIMRDMGLGRIDRILTLKKIVVVERMLQNHFDEKRKREKELAARKNGNSGGPKLRG
jgi:hypothetical protein